MQLYIGIKIIIKRWSISVSNRSQ